MKPRNNFSPATVLILETILARGPMTGVQVTEATGIGHGNVRQYLRRCAFRGLILADRRTAIPVYSAAPGLRELLTPKTVEAVITRPKPDTTVQRAIKKMPVLHNIWAEPVQSLDCDASQE